MKVRLKKRKAGEKFYRGPNRFKQSEATRLVRAATAAGIDVVRLEADPVSGKISVIGKTAKQQEKESNEWDRM
jgi:hypothetical protein